MNIIIYSLIIILVYKLLMPFVAWIVPPDKMNTAAKYIERTERRFPTKVLFKWLRQIRDKSKKNKRPM
ncbi:MAG: hypothetical protein ACYDCN_09910 [Bacteroidia bacterium]